MKTSGELSVSFDCGCVIIYIIKPGTSLHASSKLVTTLHLILPSSSMGSGALTLPLTNNKPPTISEQLLGQPDLGDNNNNILAWTFSFIKEG